MTGLSSNYLDVAAIDFGTTYSGYAFSCKEDYRRYPLNIYVSTWSGNTLQTRKAPTCVLFDPEKGFSKFGYEAEDKYMNLASGDETGQDHREWFFYRRFKMTLYDKMKLHRLYMLQDETGKEMPALDVFSAAIGYLKNHLIENIRKSFRELDENLDIRWVLTVPAIWTDACKQFMREAANMAGIKNDKLLIALEPEAASLCCLHLPLHIIGNDGKRSVLESFLPGSKYLVCDAGGGTVDITVQEVKESGKLRELYAANGGNWGGINVDQEFRHFIASIVGNDIMNNLQINKPCDLIDLFREFEIMKRTFSKINNETVQLKVPFSLLNLYMEKINPELQEYKQIKFPSNEDNSKLEEPPSGELFREFVQTKFQLLGNIRWSADKIRVDAATAKAFFNPACQSIVEHLQSLFRSGKVDDVPTIMMVGGFSESPILQEIIKGRFKDKAIIIPPEPGIAVLKGAVIFGHDPTVIEQRCCRKTYGVQILKAFREGKDPEINKFTNESGTVCCKYRFSKHVEIGQAVKVGEHYSISYKPTNADQKTAVIQFFASNQPSPEYTYDSGCQSVGSLTIDMDGCGMDRSVEVKMIFGLTELVAMAIDMKSGHQVKTTLDCLC